MDTRQWVSYGTVDRPDETESSQVEFTVEYGPLVNVTLQPSGISVRCRVGSDICGNGEGEYYPFIPGDEVLVVLPEGNEANAVIIKRLNQEIDQFPTVVAGNDVSTNTFGFKRFVAPFIFEFKASFMIFNPVHSAALIMEQGGNVTLRDGLLSFLHLGADFLGMQTQDGTLMLQMSLETNKIRLAHNGNPGKPSAIFDINGNSSVFATGGTLSLATAGNFAEFHGVTLESVLALIIANNSAIGAALTSLGAPAAASAPAFLTPGLSGLPGSATVDAAMTVASTAAFNQAYIAAINALLSIPKLPGSPGIGCVGINLG